MTGMKVEQGEMVAEQIFARLVSAERSQQPSEKYTRSTVCSTSEGNSQQSERPDEGGKGRHRLANSPHQFDHVTTRREPVMEPLRRS